MFSSVAKYILKGADMKLGKLKKVDLCEYWKHEILGFTRWLAETDILV
jgi:hypothetical protein